MQFGPPQEIEEEEKEVVSDEGVVKKKPMVTVFQWINAVINFDIAVAQDIVRQEEEELIAAAIREEERKRKEALLLEPRPALYTPAENLLEKFFERPPPHVTTFGREHKTYYTHSRATCTNVRIEVEEEGLEMPLSISRSNASRSRVREEDRLRRGSTDRAKVRARELHSA